MYTLEDDQETPSRVNKSEIAETPTGSSNPLNNHQNDQDESTAVETTDASAAAQDSVSQVSGSKKTAQVNRKAALAALTVACVGVFLTSLDQTVVVTTLPQI